MTRQNLESNIWGPKAWFFMESIALGYPTNPSDEDKKKTKRFFHALDFLLPCEKCRIHYKENLKKYPIDQYLQNRDKLFEWINKIHNEVCNSTGKKKLNVEDRLNYYLKLYYPNAYKPINLRKKKIKENNIKMIYILVFIYIIIYLVYLLYKTLY